MSLTPGSRLGPYEITDKLGEGGMGEVWRATDTKLRRDVAIKVLPPAFVEDRERLARFEREAQLLAQLQHPNIASIFGMEESAGTKALVMELVEGPTLGDRLQSGALPLDESLSIARQIAEALEEAHAKGIIHRDLKPQNVKASIEGKVKVLDFGLAKAMDPAGVSGIAPASASQLAASPTLTLGATVQGVILGSAAYMAPEQAKGLAVDKRADIWAFGVVLYEMLAGRRLFDAPTVPETLAFVLTRTPDLDELPATTPAALRRLLRRCLERNPKNRLHDIADARIVIDEVLTADGPEEPAGLPAAAPARMPLARWEPWAAVLLAAGIATGWLARGRPAGDGAVESTFSLRRLTELPGLEAHPHLSPDGKQVVYTSAVSGNQDVYVMRADGGRAINLTAGSTADDEQAAFSPDGERLVFRSSRDGGGLFLMGATGESVRRLTDDGFDPAWSPDGTRVAYSTEAVTDPYGRLGEASLWIVDLASGEKRRLPTGDAVQPAWSPDGRRIAFWANAAGQRDLWTVPVDGGDPVAVTRDLPTDWSPVWAPDGRSLYFSSDRAGGLNLFRIPIDPATGSAAGPPVQVTTSVGNLGWISVSADGRRIVAAAYELRSDLDLFRLDPEATTPLEKLRTLRPRSLHWCKLAPEADWIGCSTIGLPEDLALLRVDGAELRRLTDDAHKDRNIVWSPDGSRLIFQSTRSGPWSYWAMKTDGSGLTQLNDFPVTSSSAAWRADGRRATITVPMRGLVDLELERLTTLENLQAEPLPDGLGNFEPEAWSPSGELLAGTEKSEANDAALSIGAIDAAAGRYRRSGLPAAGPAYDRVAGWLPDSRRYVAAGARELALVDATTGAFRSLMPIDSKLLIVLSLSRDGRTLLVETPSADGDVWMLERGATGR